MARREPLTRQQVFAALQAKNISKAEVHFSGGGDEGGVDQIDLFGAGGEKVGEMEEYYANTSRFNPDTGRFEDIGPPNLDEALSEGLCVPVYDKYGGFAGDFHVSGKVVWDVASRSVSISGEESVEAYEHFDEEV